MTTNRATYRERLRALPPDEWESFLIAESGLPGRRANLELADAVADEGTEVQFLGFVGHGPETAPTGEPEEFLACCGAVGLGRLVAEGDRGHLPTLRSLASDPRWRVREAVGMALQRLGNSDVGALLDVAEAWAEGTPYERRAAVAGVCEPSVLAGVDDPGRVFDLLDSVTASAREADEGATDGHEALRKALGYGWSVAIVAAPDPGRDRFEAWLDADDTDVRWVLRENLKKARLSRLDSAWVEACRGRLEGS